jgi:hypothetical protein
MICSASSGSDKDGNGDNFSRGTLVHQKGGSPAEKSGIILKFCSVFGIKSLNDILVGDRPIFHN